jgi:hypothetical protein
MHRHVTFGRITLAAALLGWSLILLLAAATWSATAAAPQPVKPKGPPRTTTQRLTQLENTVYGRHGLLWIIQEQQEIIECLNGETLLAVGLREDGSLSVNDFEGEPILVSSYNDRCATDIHFDLRKAP